jgi:hypothetical protein
VFEAAGGAKCRLSPHGRHRVILNAAWHPEKLAEELPERHSIEINKIRTAFSHGTVELQQATKTQACCFWGVVARQFRDAACDASGEFIAGDATAGGTCGLRRNAPIDDLDCLKRSSAYIKADDG